MPTSQAADEPDSPASLLHASCTLTRAADAVYVDKGNGTTVRYYLFPEYEIHANVLDAGSLQDWHHHDRIIETLFVTAGRMEVRWAEHGGVRTQELRRGDVIEVGSTVHTFANPFTTSAEFIVFRLVPDGHDKRHLIRSDRHADTPPHAADTP